MCVPACHPMKMAPMTTEDADRFIRNFSKYHSENQHASYSSLRLALKSCTTETLKDSVEPIIQLVAADIKDCGNGGRLALMVGCIEALLMRNDASYSMSLNKAALSLLYQSESSSIDCQCIAIHCLSMMASIHSGICKDNRSLLIKWSKRGLFSGNISLVKVSACLYQALNSSSKKGSKDESETFSNVIKSLDKCVAKLTGSSIDRDDDDDNGASLVIPDLSLVEGPQINHLLTNAITGLTQLIMTHLIVQTTQSLQVLLNQLLSIIWKLMNTSVTSLSTCYVLMQNGWRLLHVAIQSCGVLLMPYSQTIEAAILKTMRRLDLPHVIVLLACACADNWLGNNWNATQPKFIEDLAINISLRADSLLQKLQSKCGSEESYIISCYMTTLCECVKGHHHILPLQLHKSIIGLCHVIKCRRIADCSKSIDEINSVLMRKCSIKLEFELAETRSQTSEPTMGVQAPPTNALMEVQAPPTNASMEVQAPPTNASMEVQAPPTNASMEVQAPPTNASMEVQAPPINASMEVQAPPTNASMEVQAPPTNASMEVQAPPTNASMEVQAPPINASMEVQAPPTNASMEVQAPPTNASMEVQAPPTNASMEVQAPPTNASMEVQAPPIPVQPDMPLSSDEDSDDMPLSSDEEFDKLLMEGFK